MISNAADARKILTMAIKASRADEAVAHLYGGVRGQVRWAVNEVTTAGDAETVSLTVESAFGKRHASATTNRLDAASIAACVRRSEAAARLMPDDPEWVGVLGPQTYAKVDGAHVKETAAFGAAARARPVAEAIGAVKGAGLVGAGFLEVDESAEALLTSKGCFAFHRATDSGYTTTTRTTDGTGSGWAGASHRDARALDIGKLTATALEKGRTSAAPRALDPGTYPVILEPEAVATLVEVLMGALGQREAEEGRSPFAKGKEATRVGEKVFSDAVTVRSDPADPAQRSEPFDGDGLPLKPYKWIEAGVLRQLHVGRYWAAKKGVAPTGYPSGVLMEGGKGSVADLVAGADKAVLVTRFWYVRHLNPRKLIITGLTRDGTFWIEKGKVVRPVKNFRFNDSPIDVLSKVEAMSEAVRTSSGWGGSAMVVPGLRVSGFHFASLSDAV
ncbi:MAG TPA: metallopeptidase TldD-related protein [Myxococcota bacterium]|jgi:predicted Zn-dependent protease|nr:metallopeptidase TldD-related protein [Myxococcota bacterium]